MPRAFASAVINVPIVQVWAEVRDFGAHASWVDDATSIELEGGGPTTVGVLRRVFFASGPALDEVLTSLDDSTWTMGYELTGQIPWPVWDVRGVIRLRPITSVGGTYIERAVDFDAEGGREAGTQMAAGFSERLGHSLRLLAAKLEDP